MSDLTVVVTENPGNRVRVHVEDDNNIALVVSNSEESVRCVVIAEQGSPGSGGGSSVPPFFEAENVTGATIKAGQPVWLSPSGAQLADATTNAKPAIGFSAVDVANAVSGEFQIEGTLELDDWTDSAGTASLSQGSYYWLSDVAGKIQTSAPTGNLRSLQQVGYATASKILAINIINYGRRA